MIVFHITGKTTLDEITSQLEHKATINILDRQNCSTIGTHTAEDATNLRAILNALGAKYTEHPGSIKLFTKCSLCPK